MLKTTEVWSYNTKRDRSRSRINAALEITGDKIILVRFSAHLLTPRLRQEREEKDDEAEENEEEGRHV